MNIIFRRYIPPSYFSEEREEEYERAKRRIFNDAGREHIIQPYKYPINLGNEESEDRIIKQNISGVDLYDSINVHFIRADYG